jgi:hypothetical protein
LIAKGESGIRALQRCVALSCIGLALLLAALEATHAHTGPTASRDASSCAICISVHAHAPAVAYYSLPVLYAIDIVVVLFQSEGKSTAPELSLFIRPPPAILQAVHSF